MQLLAFFVLVSGCDIHSVKAKYIEKRTWQVIRAYLMVTVTFVAKLTTLDQYFTWSYALGCVLFFGAMFPQVSVINLSL